MSSASWAASRRACGNEAVARGTSTADEVDVKLPELDKQHVWQHIYQMKEWNKGEPLMLERGEGSCLIDAEGKAYLDGVSSLWVNVHGHNRREINQAIVAQLEKIAHTTLLGLASS